MKPSDDPVFDGSWEKAGRNPVGASIAGLLICGALYSTIGALVLSAVALAVSARDRTWIRTDTLVDFLLSYYQRFQVSILVATTVMEFAVFFGLTFLLVRRWHSSRPVRYMRYNRPAVLDLLLAGIGAITLVPLAQLVDSWSYVLFPVLREIRGGGAALLAIRSPGQLVLVVFAVSITAAVCEEALFRGWLQRTIRRRASAVVSILVTGVVFAVFHMSPLSLAALAFVGFYLGYLFDRCGTLFASMTAHCLYNLTIIVLVNMESRLPFLLKDGDMSLPVVICSFALFAIAVVLIERRSRARRAVRVSAPVQ